MSFRTVELPESVPGSLWLASMPARDEPWTRFEARARDRGIDLIVCLTSRAEVAPNLVAARDLEAVRSQRIEKLTDREYG